MFYTERSAEGSSRLCRQLPERQYLEWLPGRTSMRPLLQPMEGCLACSAHSEAGGKQAVPWTEPQAKARLYLWFYT